MLLLILWSRRCFHIHWRIHQLLQKPCWNRRCKYGAILMVADLRAVEHGLNVCMDWVWRRGVLRHARKIQKILHGVD